MYPGRPIGNLGGTEVAEGDGVGLGVVTEMRKSRMPKLEQGWKRGKTASCHLEGTERD